MLLSARMMTDVGDVNTFRYVDSVEFTEGDAPAVYFQLIDRSKDKDYRPQGRRFCPAAAATLQVVIKLVDSAKTITRFASQPFAEDPSIWMLQLQSTDAIKGTVSFLLTLTEGAATTRGRLDAALSVSSQVQGF